MKKKNNGQLYSKPKLTVYGDLRSITSKASTRADSGRPRTGTQTQS